MNDKAKKLYNALTSEMGSSETDLLDELLKEIKGNFKSGLYCVKVRGRGESHIKLTAQEAKTLTRLAEGRWNDLQAIFKL